MAATFQAKRAKIVLLGCLLLLGYVSASPAFGASQYFSPSAGSYTAHAQFTVSVYADSADEPASAFSGLIHFPADKLRVEAVSKAGSIIGLWIREPAYSNTDGTISFEGLIPNPGYLGSGGKLLSITFQALGDDSIDLTFSEGLILANDGQGTDITTTLGSAAFVLSPEDGAKPADEIMTNPTFASVEDDSPPTGRVAGIHTALASVVNSVSGGAAGGEARDTPDGGSQISFSRIIELVILVVVALLICLGILVVAFLLITFIHRHTRLAVRDLAHLRSRRLHRVLDGLDQDIHKHLRQLERLSRSKNTSKEAQRVVLSTSRQLVELGDEISRSLKEL